MSTKVRTLTAREIVKRELVGNATNTRVVKYGKINRNIAFELSQENGAYLDSKHHGIIFVEFCPETNTTSTRDDLSMHLAEIDMIEAHIEDIKSMDRRGVL